MAPRLQVLVVAWLPPKRQLWGQPRIDSLGIVGEYIDQYRWPAPAEHEHPDYLHGLGEELDLTASQSKAMKVAPILVGLLVSVTPLLAQTEERGKALAAAVEYALADSRFADAPRSAILFDTLRADVATKEAAQIARKLGLKPGISEEHCRRFVLEESWARRGFPVGVEVHGVDAIVTARFSIFTSGAALVWVSIVSGSGPYLNGRRSYILRRDSAQWDVWPHWRPESGSCQPRLSTAALALAAQTMLDDLNASGPTCLDPTGMLLLERDSVAAVLGAQIQGAWWPEIEGIIPEAGRNPCARARTQWGSVVRFLHVEWEPDGLIRVTVEGRVPAAAAARRVRYTLRKEDGRWSVERQEEVSGQAQG